MCLRIFDRDCQVLQYTSQIISVEEGADGIILIDSTNRFAENLRTGENSQLVKSFFLGKLNRIEDDDLVEGAVFHAFDRVSAKHGMSCTDHARDGSELHENFRRLANGAACVDHVVDENDVFSPTSL